MENRSMEQLKTIQREWMAICNGRMDEYVEAFKSNGEFTSYIGRVVEQLGEVLGLKVYSEYYALDHIFYKEEDLVPNMANTWSKGPTHWFKRIRIAFEHENNLIGPSGGYQEFSHLMITNADAKVLVGYGSSFDDYDVYARDYQSLMSGLDNNPAPILFIGEYAPKINQEGKTYLCFESYIISQADIKKYEESSGTWIELQ